MLAICPPPRQVTQSWCQNHSATTLERDLDHEKNSLPNNDQSFQEHASTWKDAPFLQGSTKFEPQSEIRNIMITGGAGFIASWVVRHLTRTYAGAYNIISFDKLDYCATLNNTAQLDEDHNFTFCKGDITKRKDVMDCLRKYDVDTIMHFAAQSHVDLSFGDSDSFIETNVHGTNVMLECARVHGIKKFIHVSTDEVYGETHGNSVSEDATLEPTNPYSASKAAAEMMVKAYQMSFRLPTILVRSNNVYGPHQYPEKVIPKFTLLLQQGRRLPLHGDGTHTRRYLYAGDAADAFDTILHKGVPGQVYNVPSTDEISNVDLCSMLLDRFGHTDADVSKHITYCQDRPFNDHRYAIDGSKLQELGWRQRTTINEGLRTTVEWYRKYARTWWGDVSNNLATFLVCSSGERPEDLGKTDLSMIRSKSETKRKSNSLKLSLKAPIQH